MRVDYSLIDRTPLTFPIFYPRPDRTGTPPGASDHLLEVAPGVSLAARFYPAGPADPVILYFHGNGEVVGDHDDIAPLYRGLGVGLFVVDFRGYGGSGGRPGFVALNEDAHPVAEGFHALLDARGMTGPRFVMGRSLGSYPALELAANRPEGLRGLILESAAANLRRMFARFAVPVPAEESGELLAAHEAKIASVRLPVLMLHGERDDLIPLEHARGIRDLMKLAEREFVVIPGAGHNDILWRGGRDYLGAVARFVGKEARG